MHENTVAPVDYLKSQLVISLGIAPGDQGFVHIEAARNSGQADWAERASVKA
jgi:hypothetical protein